VTIIAGFKFKEGAVLCADTQETVGEVIKNQVPKLRFERQFRNGTDMAVAFCGATDSGAFVDKLITLAWTEAKKAADLDDACRRIEQSIKDTHEEFGNIFQSASMPSAELIFGVTMNKCSRLFHSEGPIVNEKQKYAVGGVGQYLANFLVRRMYWEYLTASQCVTLAAYVLFQTKGYVEGCGGDSHIALLRNDESSGLVNEKFIEEITELCQYGDFEGGRLMRLMADLDCTGDDFEQEVTRAANVLRAVRDHRIPAFQKRLTEDRLLEAKLNGVPFEDVDMFGLPKKPS
jgi:20S proteasome alpha/beta subunit